MQTAESQLTFQRNQSHLQGRRISQARNQRESKQEAELGFFFDPEDRGDVFLQNVIWLSTDYMACLLIFGNIMGINIF
jgi:hypothetical protein